MDREEFLSYCQKGQLHRFTDEEHDYGCKLFLDDADGEAKLAMPFYRFLIQINFIHGSHDDPELHSICLHYAANFEQNNRVKGDDPATIYMMLAEYYLELNVYSESYRNLMKALECEPSNVDIIAVVHCMIISEMWESGMHDESRVYFDRLEELCNSGVFDARRQYNIMVILMMDYCFFNEHDKLNETKKWLEEHKNDEGCEIPAFFYRIYLLNIDTIMNGDNPPKAEYLERLKDILKSTEYISQTADTYAEIFGPIFRHIRPLVDDGEMESLIFTLADAVRSRTDRLDLFEMLVDEFGFTFEEHPKIYEAYYNDLKEYYMKDKRSRRSIITSEQRAQELRLSYKREIVKDTLTGIGNRRAYEDELEEMYHEPELPENLCIGMLDMNGLKEANDRCGHDMGDKCIIEVAATVTKAVEGIGHAYRIGGDEFTIIVRAEELEVAKRMKSVEEMLKKFAVDNDCDISISYGFSWLSELSEHDRAQSNMDCVHQLVKMADRHMYNYKDKYYAQLGHDRRRR